MSLYSLILAPSGERKSQVDKLFTGAIKDFERQRAEELAPEAKRLKSEHDAWEATRNGILDKIQRAEKDPQKIKISPEGLKQQLIDHGAKEPPILMLPKIKRGDDTTENLAYALVKEWPTGAVIEPEAGVIFGAHAMQPDKIMAALGFKNKLWDGVSRYPIGRKSGSFVVDGVRFTFGLQIQRATLEKFSEKSGDLMRGIGTWARFLMCEPKSTQGYRPYKEPPKNTPALNLFYARMMKLLKTDFVIDEHGAGIKPKVLLLDAEAKAAWVEAHDAFEIALRVFGEYDEIRDLAAKAAENVVRVAALLHVFENGPEGDIGADSVLRAEKIVRWHLSEAKIFFTETAPSEEDRDAEKLERWLLKYCKEHDCLSVPKREAHRDCFRGTKKGGERLDKALAILEENGRARLVMNGKQKWIEVRPGLIDGGEECPF